MPPDSHIKLASQLIKAQDAADLLNVDVGTVQRWIKEGSIPYVQLPGGGERPSYRIPLQGLVNSLSGNYDLAKEIDELYGGAEH
ncbi:MAG TPA: helix-turn-helix domain-containing protein [Solirubrobacteraceae bacterium]|jgi:excisionase family DNA binding protein|nr:helix-turn-helix domain-containing protein [Solirubrobacteraceae bacterium]